MVWLLTNKTVWRPIIIESSHSRPHCPIPIFPVSLTYIPPIVLLTVPTLLWHSWLIVVLYWPLTPIWWYVVVGVTLSIDSIHLGSSWVALRIPSGLIWWVSLRIPLGLIWWGPLGLVWSTLRIPLQMLLLAPPKWLWCPVPHIGSKLITHIPRL